MARHAAYRMEQEKYQEMNIFSTRADTVRHTELDSDITLDLPYGSCSATVGIQTDNHTRSIDAEALAVM